MTGPKCVVSTCQKIPIIKGTRLAFHKFPRDPGLKRLWFRKLGLGNLSTDSGFVCSNHFAKEDYVRDLQAELLGYVGRRKLKPHAVPTLNLPFQKEEISQEEKERLQKEQHQKLIEDCLNDDGQHRSILSFELFKKLKYSNCRSRRGRKPNNTPSRAESDALFKVKHREREDASNVVVVTLPTGEEHLIRLNSINGTDLIQEDSNLSSDIFEDMNTEMESSLDVDKDDPDYLRLKVKALENQTARQKKLICSLRRQIIREKKMMEKIIIATNCERALPPVRRKYPSDDKARAALLELHSLAPHMYSQFSKALNLPSKSVLESWFPEINPSFQEDSSQKETEEVVEEDFQEQDFVEEEFTIESEEYVPE